MERQLEKKKISDNQIPFDLIPDIFKGLPVKSLARFLCVSKEYASIIRNRDFMKSYLNKSSNRPQSLIFTFKGYDSWNHFFFSSILPQNQGESSSSSSSVATYHMKCHSQPYTTFAPSVHGLICYGRPSKLMVYNPSTRRSITLPEIDSERKDMHHFLGYDPIDGDYKVLCMTTRMHGLKGRGLAQELRVLTLGDGNSWRMIEDFPPHHLDSPFSPDICIDGVLYYGAFLEIDVSQAFMSFDVRSENFDLIKGPVLPHRASHLKVTSYQGKLAVLSTKISDFAIEFWVLEDAVKNEWSKKFYFLAPIDNETYYGLHPFCVANEDELVLAPETIVPGEAFYVLYYDPKKISVRRVYIEGFTELKLPVWDKDSDRCAISIFPGQVENLMFL